MKRIQSLLWYTLWKHALNINLWVNISLLFPKQLNLFTINRSFNNSRLSFLPTIGIGDFISSKGPNKICRSIIDIYWWFYNWHIYLFASWIQQDPKEQLSLIIKQIGKETVNHIRQTTVQPAQWCLWLNFYLPSKCSYW